MTRHLLRPARAQRGLRPPVAGAGRGRRRLALRDLARAPDLAAAEPGGRRRLPRRRRSPPRPREPAWPPRRAAAGGAHPGGPVDGGRPGGQRQRAGRPGGARGRGPAAARAQLLAVETVDGHPVAVREALEGARGAELERRARLIAASVGEADAARAAGRGPPRGASGARRAPLPRRRAAARRSPGRCEWLGDRIEPVVDWIDDRGASVPGRADRAVDAARRAACCWPPRRVTSTTIRRRALAIERARGRRCPPPTIRARSSARPSAPSATATGSAPCGCASAPGCCGSTAGSVIVYRPSLTTGEVARAVGSPAFTRGRRRASTRSPTAAAPAERDDAEHARRGWAEVLDVRLLPREPRGADRARRSRPSSSASTSSRSSSTR